MRWSFTTFLRAFLTILADLGASLDTARTATGVTGSSSKSMSQSSSSPDTCSGCSRCCRSLANSLMMGISEDTFCTGFSSMVQ